MSTTQVTQVKFKVNDLDRMVILQKKGDNAIFDLQNPDDIQMFYALKQSKISKPAIPVPLLTAPQDPQDPSDNSDGTKPSSFQQYLPELPNDGDSKNIKSFFKKLPPIILNGMSNTELDELSTQINEI